MILDHVGLPVADFHAMRAFLVAALRPLDAGVVVEGETWAMFGRAGRAGLRVNAGDPPAPPMHVAFAADTREQVRAFHRAALAAGGRDNGAPGIRAHYGPTYYGAFVIGPEGHNFEAVTRTPDDD